MIVSTQSISPLFTEVDTTHASHRLYPSIAHARLLLPQNKMNTKIGLQIFCNKQQRIKMAAHSIFSNKQPHYVENEDMQALKIAAGSPDAVSVVSLGTPGPYNKQTVLLLDKNHQPISITKVGTNKYTQSLLENESYWLKTINNIDNLSDLSPLLIQSGTIGSFYFLTQSVSAGTSSSEKLTVNHINFLSLLQNIEEPVFSFAESKMCHLLIRRSQYLKGKMNNEWEQRTSHALTHITSVFHTNNIPMVATHRDFGPWNIKKTDKNIFVFDWEYASSGYIPLYDIFHFIVMPLALSKKLITKDIDYILSETEKFGLYLDNGSSKIQRSRTQLLAYLLDICLFYLESNNGKSKGDSVVNYYSLLIDKLSKIEYL